jgi:aconitate decarboxylase
MTSTSTTVHATEPGPTQQLSTWVSSMNLDQVPEYIRTRAKYLILDGLACALVGAHLPWSEKAANAVFDMEPVGDSTVFGWNRKISPVSAALINSTFIQGFELDDFHSAAPLHSNSILIPAILAASEHFSTREDTTAVSGSDFLLSMIVGYEVGPRVGLALYGPHVLSQGWHSGTVFGPAAAAAAVGRLIGLSASQIEDAFGIACTQACGLMSAQFGSEVKRMQHGFASRNGLLAALLARGGYVGIKGVFEQEYGGFLKQFSLGNGKTPPYVLSEITKELGQTWTTDGVRVKPYASMGGTHPTIDCVRKLQENHPEQMQDVKAIKRIKIEMGEAAFKHGGWKATRPLTSTGAQMSNAYIAATQIVDGQVLPAQFRYDMLERDDLWRLVALTECVRTESLDSGYSQIVTIDFDNQPTIKQRVEGARGVNPALSNEEILEKWRLLTRDIINPERMKQIEETVLDLENCKVVSFLADLMSGVTKNPIE